MPLRNPRRVRRQRRTIQQSSPQGAQLPIVSLEFDATVDPNQAQVVFYDQHGLLYAAPVLAGRSLVFWSVTDGAFITATTVDVAGSTIVMDFPRELVNAEILILQPNQGSMRGPNGERIAMNRWVVAA